MDKLDKFLNKLSKKESAHILSVLSDILSGDISRYDVKRLSGYRDIYRIRAGSIRIIFRHTHEDTRLLDIGRRSEKTYKDF